MKLKTLAVMVAIFAGTAFFVDSTSVLASSLCSNSASPCPEGDAYPIGTDLIGTLHEGSAALAGEKGTLKCGGSSLSGETTASGTPMVGQIAALSFSSCELGCTVAAAHLPYKAEIEYTASGDGVLTLSNGGSGVPQIKNTCFGGTCTFGASKIMLDVEGDSPAKIRAVNESLVREGGEKLLCGDSAQWSVAYRLSEPMALFVAPREAPPISLCSNSASPCPEGDAYPIGTDLIGTLHEGSAALAGEKGTLKCGGSSLSGETTASGTPMVGQIAALSFSSCELGCTVAAAHLPYKAEIEYTASGDGVLTLSNGGSGVPQIKNTCFGITCTFGATKILLDIEGDSPAKIRAVNELLAREGGVKSQCGDTTQWSTVYRVSEPMALFVGLAGTRMLYFGISADTRSKENPGPEQDLAAETGVDRLREDLEWEDVEPSDDNWQWSKTDTLYKAAAERGLSILPVLNSPPCWAVPKGTEASKCWQTYPVSDSEYAEFVAHAAERYGPSGDFWDAHPELNGALAPRYFEIWNEPYIREFTNGELNPARYTSLYKAAVIAGRSANAATRYLVESTADLFIEGTGVVNWADAMVNAEPSIGNYVDGVAIHPYPDNHDPYYQPASGLEAAFKKTNRVYADWVDNGIKRPIWITEIGYSSCSKQSRCVFGEAQVKREELKARWLGDMLAELGSDEYSYVHAVYLYNLRQWEDPKKPNENVSAWFGILNGSKEHLLAWDSFSGVVEQLQGTPTGHALILGQSIGGGNASFTFTLTDLTATASCQLDAGAWSACTSPKSYTGLGGGSHTFRVRATNAETTEASPATYSW